jgi:hypothetical protein
MQRVGRRVYGRRFGWHRWLTTYEIRDYRRQLESAIKGIAADAPIQAVLRRKLDAVLAEQEERARIAHARA